MWLTLYSFIFFNFVLGQCLAVDKPTIIPAGPTVEVTAGHQLEITCKSSKEIQFFKPPAQELGGIKSTKAVEEEHGVPGSHTHIMRKLSTTIADTGYYGCANVGVNVDTTKHDQSDVTWIQVLISNI